MSTERFDPAPVLAGLKDFQRASVDHAFSRLYADHDPVTKFLVADEVGLGKTMVARGVIARTINHLWNDIERIDIIYICSNRTIAEQNIRRLNVFEDTGFSFSSRMTMIARNVSSLRGNKVNFVSFTPGTSFDLKSSLGMSDERILLWLILRRLWGDDLLTQTGARRVFQGWLTSLARFDELAGARAWWGAELDADMLEGFSARLQGTNLRAQLEELVGRWDVPDPDDSAHSARASFVGELRSHLATECVAALEPDLVILDEFQRFRDLLTSETEAGALANDLFDFEDNRTLLLSATPYKMYTASGDDEDDHHRDFVNTVRFLLGDDHLRFEAALDRFRALLLDIDRVTPAAIRDARRAVEHELRRVMVRTERLAVGDNRNGMLREVSSHVDGLTAGDVRSYVALEHLSQHLDSGSMVEYWKSAPYFLNFTDGYKLDARLTQSLDDPASSGETARLATRVEAQVDWERWRRYEALDGANPRLRDLIGQTSGNGRWKMLWLAPSMPDYQLEGPWAEPGAAAFTKRLIFSAWAAVPKAIASLVSYDAERQIMALRPERPLNDLEDRKKIRGLLQFRRTPTGEPGAMSAFGLLYPSWTLAKLGDPLETARALGRTPTLHEVKETISEAVESALATLPASPQEGRVDESWYWAAPMLLDRARDLSRWMGYKGLNLYSWLGGESENGDNEDDASAFREHVHLAHQVYRGDIRLGRRPDDLVEVLTLQALGNPATVALRSLLRVLEDQEDRWVWDAACHIAWGFRTLYNLPEASSIIRHIQDDGRYWQEVLSYGADGGLGPVLDEYLHCLRDLLGLFKIDSWKDVHQLAEECNSAVSLKTSDLVARDHLLRSGVRDHRFRSRFALRFGNERSETDDSVVRAGQVRTAFNSPFWPFVLASTSVGQEGLDFHVYCHAVVHWNLPSNPVDLEQREGRVHRFKGHAIRRNIAARHHAVARESAGDPWRAAFDAAVAERAEGENDLVPYWVYPGPASIERYVPALPLSREVTQLVDLKRSVALYRLVFGQPRQEDLLEYLSGEHDPRLLDELRIDLSPDESTGSDHV